MYKADEKIIVILDFGSGGIRFSRVAVFSDCFSEQPVEGKDLFFCIYPGQIWKVRVENIFPKGSEINRHDEEDVFFLKSDDEELFEVLCKCVFRQIEDGADWYEGENALL